MPRKLNVRRRTGAGLARKSYVGEVIDAVEAAIPSGRTGVAGSGGEIGEVYAIVGDPVDGQAGKYSGKSIDRGNVNLNGTEDLAADDLGDAADDDDVVIWYLPQITGGPSLAADQVVAGYPLDLDGDGKLVVVVPAAGVRGATFAVKLSAPASGGGSNGSDSAAPTYAYVVSDIGDNVLDSTDDSPLQPLAGRQVGLFDRAGWGEAFWDTDGSLKLLRAFETEQVQTDCGS